MIEIECDNCDKTFTVEESEAGTKVACPACGDINRVPASEPAVVDAEPARVAPVAAASVAAASVAKPVRSSVLEEETGERELSVVRPAMFRAHPVRYLAVVLTFVGALAVAIASQVSETLWPWLLWPAALVVVISLGWFGHWWLSTHWWMKLIISNKRTVRHEGIIRRHTTEVLHDHVRSVDIEQNFIQRVMGVGSMGIDSAGQEDIEIQVKDIPRPYEVKKLIDRYRKM